MLICGHDISETYTTVSLAVTEMQKSCFLNIIQMFEVGRFLLESNDFPGNIESQRTSIVTSQINNLQK